jgi:NADH-quinone oxidoreductase subunit N
MVINHGVLLPAYLAAGTAVLAFLVDLLLPGRRGALLLATAAGAAATGVVALLVDEGVSFCVPEGGCSYELNAFARLVIVLFAALTLGVVALSVPALRTGDIPAGEYCFLLACSMTGGVLLGASRDLLTLVVALETLTLPLYVLVGLRRKVLASAEAAVTFLVVSVVSTAVTLLGVALLYAGTGAVHLFRLQDVFADGIPAGPARPLIGVGLVLIVVGLGFKVAAVPLHGWAPSTYDGAPVPVAAYLSTASKLGGVVALLLVGAGLGRSWPQEIVGPAFAVLAVLTMTVGNLVALRQTRMVRLLAWSSVAQAGYILAPLGALALADGRGTSEIVLGAVLAYTVFYVLLELTAFGAVVALRGGSADGGTIADYAGAARRSPWTSAVFLLALAGLAGLPPGLAGLFAKVAVVRALLGGSAVWLAVVVAINAVIGLAYYVRVAVTMFGPPPASVWSPAGEPARVRVAWPVAVTLTAATVMAFVIGLAPELVMQAAEVAAEGS